MNAEPLEDVVEVIASRSISLASVVPRNRIPRSSEKAQSLLL